MLFTYLHVDFNANFLARALTEQRIEKIWNSFSLLGSAFNFGNTLTVRFFFCWYLNSISLCTAWMAQKLMGSLFLILSLSHSPFASDRIVQFLAFFYFSYIPTNFYSTFHQFERIEICNILLIFVCVYVALRIGNAEYFVVCYNEVFEIQYGEPKFNMAHYIRWRAVETL